MSNWPTRTGVRVSVVTGAGRGLGRAVAVALAARGDRVALVARSAEQLRDVEHAIEAAGGTAVAFPVDVTDPAAVESLARAVEWRVGPASVLVNAAGVFGPIALVKDGNVREWLRTVQVNLFGPYLTCRAFVGGMIDRGHGRIVNFSSAAALHPPGPLNSAYGTSKVALNQFTRQLAAELAGTGVTANVIHPGDVKTEMWADIRDKADAMGPEGEPYRGWVKWVEQTGGDDPRKAGDLVLKLTADDEYAARTSGQFLWIEGALQKPIPSWDPPKDERPWK